jgi:signal transduction histidine kinase
VPVQIECDGLPDQLPFPLKACLYRFALEGLELTRVASRDQRLHACCDADKMVIEIVGDRGLSVYTQPIPADTPIFNNLRDRIEAVGGEYKIAATPDGGLSLVAELSVSDMELARG